MNAMTRVVRGAVEVLPDSDRYLCRFKVRSSSSDSLHLISYDNANGAHWWTCSCLGNIRHGQCTHLDECGLKGRKYGKTAFKRPQVTALID